MKRKEYETYKVCHSNSIYPTKYYANKHKKENEIIIKVSDGYKIVKTKNNEVESKILNDVYTKTILNLIQHNLDIKTQITDNNCIIKIRNKQLPKSLFEDDSIELKITDESEVELIKLMSNCLNF